VDHVAGAQGGHQARSGCALYPTQDGISFQAPCPPTAGTPRHRAQTTQCRYLRARVFLAPPSGVQEDDHSKSAEAILGREVQEERGKGQEELSLAASTRVADTRPVGVPSR